MKSIWFKKRLEKELPYPKLTAKANRRFDEILGHLPEQETSARRGEPAHFAKAKKRRYQEKQLREDTGELVFLNTVPRRRWPGIIAGAAVSLAALFLMSLVMLNTFRPDIAETLPALGGFFQAWNHRGETPELPPDSSETELDESREKGLFVQDAYTLGGYLFLSLRLDPPDQKTLQAQWLSASFPGMEQTEDGPLVIWGGQTLGLYRDLVLEKVSEHFEGTLVAYLPDPEKRSELWEGRLEIPILYGVKEQQELSYYGGEKYPMPEVILNQPLSASFQTEHRWPQSDEDTQIQVRDFSLENGMAKLRLRYPAVVGEAELWAEIYDETGTQLLADMSKNYGSEGHDTVSGDGNMEEAVFDLSDFYSGCYFVFCGSSTNGRAKRVALAEYWLNPESGEAYPTTTVQDNNPDQYAYCSSPEEFAAAAQAGTPFYQHFWISPAFDLWGDSHPETGKPYANVQIYSDVDSDFPVEAAVWVDDNELYRIPLWFTEGYERAGDSGLQLVEDGYEVYLASVQGEDYRRGYSLNLWFPWEEGASFWETARVWLELRDTVTGEVFLSRDIAEKHLSNDDAGHSEPQSKPSEMEPTPQPGGDSESTPSQPEEGADASSQPEDEPENPVSFPPEDPGASPSPGNAQPEVGSLSQPEE